MTSNSARNMYRQIEVDGSNGLQLVAMLYDGAIRFLGEAKACLEKNDQRGGTMAINRTFAILNELQSTLNLDEGGDIARSLDRLYTYMTERILDANIKGDANGLNEAIKLLQTLNSAWKEIAQRAGQTEGIPAERSAAPARHVPGASLEFFG